MSEYSNPVNIFARGRKRRRNSPEWEKNRKKVCRNSVEARVSPHVSCNHDPTTHWCRAGTLVSEDVQGK